MKIATLKRCICAPMALTLSGCLGTPTPLAPGLSGSIGLPAHGSLTNAAELPETGLGFRRFRPYGKRNYGTPSLISAIERAAQTVQREAENTPDLVVGDLSAQYGGKISGHASHRTGRDVDLLFYSMTLSGVPIRTPGFVHFGSDSLAHLSDGRFIALDIRRQWLLTRALLTDPNIEVLWMFASRDVEAFLIDYARSIGEPASLVLAAERVLHQPRDSANHDDHIHLRIACTKEERVLGCESGGPSWPWVTPPLELDTTSVFEQWSDT